MNRIDKGFNRIVYESITALLQKDTADYEQTRLIMLSYKSNDEKIKDYLRKLFQFTDMHRPLLIEMKEGAV
ncbi:hypothetical protein MCI89_20455 [Muricomes sp. OA1]|uniref:hypothetical protein n=1 Tax=Lachnospiraceae TaxID=186803 RepID=UPI00129E1486|nr:MULTISPECIES: hypothetical protein [Lachnospiraceae]MCH1974718.1 hypothetical protein [Muricomes sp. OA1]MRM89646.1 hypothetical protein [Faecalicatena contorta]GKH33500.1 hypothetical protein CE91St64_29070 [Faecalicatena contorta]